MNGVQIRVGDLLYAIGKRWKMILAFVLVGCGFGAALSGISYVQGNYTNYRINCSIAVTSQSETGNFTGNSSYFNPNDFYLAQDMVDAVGYVMKSERVLREAAESVRIVDPDPVAIARNLDIERYNETQIIEISLKWHDADTGIRLMNAILDTSREVLPKTLMVGSVSTIDEPQAEYIMGMGGLSHIWLITGVMGFIMGAGMAMLELIMRPTLLNLKDVENVFGLETMGIIPNDQEYFRDGRVILEKDGMTDSAVRQNFTSAAYILQNRLGLKDETCSFYVTSAEEGEGKSTVAANLAVQLSDMEKRTLLLDLNTRAPRLGGMFLQDLPYSRTLNALYKGESAEPEAVISLTGYLDLLPMVLEPDAVPLDAALFDFLKPIMEPYEYVIIDASSVGRSSDVLRLNKLADHALFVVRHDATPLSVIQDAIEKLNKSGVQLLGCVVNEVQSLEIFPLHPEHIAAPIRKKKKKPENADSPLPEDLLRPADSALEPTWKPAGDGRSVMDELTDDLQRSQNTRSDDEIMWELLLMGKDGSWKRPERKPTADSSAAQPPQSIPDVPPAAPVPAEKPKPVQPEPEAESKAGLLPWTEPEPEPKPEKKRSRAPKPAAAPKHGKASSRGGLGLWGKKPKH